MLALDMKHVEESRPGFTKIWRNENEHFTLEVSTKWKN